MFNPRTTATILAALRCWQRDIPKADPEDEHTPLTAEEIDTLCEQINCSPDNDWIPVTTRLPDADTSVIACTDEGSLGEAFLDGETWRWSGSDRIEGTVTHWKEFGDLPDKTA